MPPRRRLPDQRHAGARESRGEARAAQDANWVYGRHAVTAALANPLRRVQRFLCLRDNIEEAARLLAAARVKERPARAEPVDRHALEAYSEPSCTVAFDSVTPKEFGHVLVAHEFSIARLLASLSDGCARGVIKLHKVGVL